MNFTDFDVDEFFGLGDDTGLLMTLVWILPVVIFVFYGQRIQLYITSGEIKKNIKKLDAFKTQSKTELVHYVKNNCNPQTEPDARISQFIDYFAIPPVDLDPNGIVPKIRHTVRSKEQYTRDNIRLLMPEISDGELNKVQTLLEVAATLAMLYKVVNHLFLTAKKQNNYPLILPLQMMLPFIMDEAKALNAAISAFKQNQPVGDSIGPLVVGRIMLDTVKEKIAFQTVIGRTEYENRKLILMKAEGPSSTVGRPADGLDALSQDTDIDAIITVDAALKFEGEDSAGIAQGFGTAMGGIGTERFEIEEIAAKKKIPVFAVIVKQSVREAVTLMTQDIAQKESEVRDRVYDIIKNNTGQGQTILVIGVGNTVGVPQ